MTHHYVTKNPQSSARRQHVHGKLRSLSEEARAIGEPSLVMGTLLLASVLGIIAAFVLVLGALHG